MANQLAQNNESMKHYMRNQMAVKKVEERRQISESIRNSIDT